MSKLLMGNKWGNETNQKGYSLSDEAIDSDALILIGNIYAKGEWVTQDYEEAMRWYKKAEEMGNPRSFYYIGCVYAAEGWGHHSYKKAMKFYQKAADGGDALAMDALGDLYRDYKLNMNVAMMWYRKAMKSGEVDYDEKYLAGKMYFIAEMFETGKGIKKDEYEANYWYVKAVGAGSKEAGKKIRIAAKDGKSDAMMWLGKMYEEGKGVRRDYSEAMRWYIKAANRGNPYAMNKIGTMYYEGKGVEKDYDQARVWYYKSINAGSDVAKKKLEKMESILRYNAETKKQKSRECFIAAALAIVLVSLMIVMK